MNNRPQTRFDVDTRTVTELFGARPISYEVPRFQRRYAWGGEEVSELLGDVFSNLAESAPTDEYFLGSIVLSHSTTSGVLQVLDGQQRLTTTALILSCLAHKIRQLGGKEYTEIERHLFSGRLGESKRPLLRLQEADQPLLEQLLRDWSTLASLSAVDRRTTLGRAAAVIEHFFNAQLTGADRADLERLEAYASRLLYEVVFVQIVAPSDAAAFELFETLNDRGLDLSAADLVKNKILARVGENHFGPAADKWDEMVRLVGTGELIGFLRFHWIAEFGFVRKAGLYRVYSNEIARRKPKDVLTLLDHLHRNAKVYRHILHPDAGDPLWPHYWPDELRETLRRLNDFRARSCRPIFLAVAQDPGAFLYAARFAESMTLRHSVIGDGNANILERGYAQACESLRKGSSIQEALALALGPSMPTDEEFRTSVMKARMAKSNDAWRRILLELNARHSTGETSVRDARTVNIEHIFPQSPTPELLNELGLSKSEYQDVIGMLGNLTLLLATKNQEATNRSFLEKRSVYATSEIIMTRELAMQEAWTVEDIIKRTESMADEMIEIWPRQTR